MINGVTQLNMTKADVLSIFDTIQICTHYQIDGRTIDYMPYDAHLKDIKPVYKSMKGWTTDLTGLYSENDFPSELSDYIAFLEHELETPITIVSVGPDRKQTVLRKAVVA